MRRLTQREVVSRVYNLQKQQWLKINAEEPTTGLTNFDNGVRHEQSAIDLKFKPFWTLKRFDANVSKHAFIKHALQSNTDQNTFKNVLNANEYYVVNYTRITK